MAIGRAALLGVDIVPVIDGFRTAPHPFLLRKIPAKTRVLYSGDQSSPVSQLHIRPTADAFAVGDARTFAQRFIAA